MFESYARAIIIAYLEIIMC